MVEPLETARVSLPDVMRRLPLALLALAAVGGCTTFTGEGHAARLGDRELTIDELEATLADAGSVPVDGTIDAAAARQAINNWWFDTIVADPDLVDGYAGLVERYASGDGSLGAACLYVLQAGDRAAAEAYTARIAEGEAWDTIAGELGAPDNGRQECSPFTAFNPTIVTQLAALPVDGTPTVIDDPGGSPIAFVVRAATADEVTPGDLVPIAIVNDPTPLADSLWVNPSYGRFDARQLGVVALG